MSNLENLLRSHGFELLSIGAEQGSGFCNACQGKVQQVGGAVLDVFCKWIDRQQAQEATPPALLLAEAAGLAALCEVGELMIPRVLVATQHLLMMEYIPPACGIYAPDSFWEQLARGLVVQHRRQRKQFGFAVDTYCGATVQPNRDETEGWKFFAEQRLNFQGRLARDRGLLNADEVALIERVGQRLRSLIPDQPASLLHGDLWHGNVLRAESGQPCLIDPACWYGWREADIAMTSLFGGFPKAFYRTYDALWPMEPGWNQRLPLYNLYHLLNHLNLFGSSYHARVVATLKQFA